MSLEIIRNDITRVKVDAIVNAANNSLLGGGGVDGAIHRAAGPELLEECRTLGGCKTGDAKITKGYKLPAKYVIHTVGPIWNGGDNNENELLESCYKKSLELAKNYKCRSIAFPLISAGVYGYPKQQALKIAVDTIKEFLLWNNMKVYIVIFNKEITSISHQLFDNVKEYIDDVYVSEHTSFSRVLENNYPTPYRDDSFDVCDVYEAPVACPSASTPAFASSSRASSAFVLDDIELMVDESFSQMLLRKIDEKGITDSACYNKAGVDRKLFSKIRTNRDYRPSKPTVIAFAFALELSIEDTRELLLKAGFALSHSNKFDIIIEYFILHGNYDMFAVNEVLLKFDQPLL